VTTVFLFQHPHSNHPISLSSNIQPSIPSRKILQGFITTPQQMAPAKGSKGSSVEAELLALIHAHLKVRREGGGLGGDVAWWAFMHT
jgi:hypothetical protein